MNPKKFGAQAFFWGAAKNGIFFEPSVTFDRLTQQSLIIDRDPFYFCGSPLTEDLLENSAAFASGFLFFFSENADCFLKKKNSRSSVIVFIISEKIFTFLKVFSYWIKTYSKLKVIRKSTSDYDHFKLCCFNLCFFNHKFHHKLCWAQQKKKF